MRCEGPDLRLAVRRGLLLLPVRGCDSVALSGRILRFDPEMPPHERATRVLSAIASLKPS